MKYKLPVRTKIFLALFLITILTSFLQSHLDRISREENERRIEGGFMSTITKIGQFFKTIGKKLKNVAKGFEIVGAGLYSEIIGIGKTGNLLVENTVKVATCVGQKINNYGFCSKYYFLDVIIDTFYSIFITLPLFTIKMFLGINLFSIEREMLNYAKEIDNIMYNSTNIRMSKYPENILDKCYRCKPEIPSQAEQNKKIVGFLKKPIDDIGDGFKKVFSIFS